MMIAIALGQINTTPHKAEEGKIVEIVLWKAKAGVSTEEAKTAIASLNDFVKTHAGFISRKTALSEDGRFVDIIYWTDLASALAASEKAMQNEKALKVFSTIDEEDMIFQHFEIFNIID